MNQHQKIALTNNMRRYGGNFVSRLAEAMIAADPVNFSKLVNAFPEIVEKFSQPERSNEEQALQWIEYWSDPKNQKGRRWMMIGYGHIPDFVNENDELVVQIMQKSANSAKISSFDPYAFAVD